MKKIIYIAIGISLMLTYSCKKDFTKEPGVNLPNNNNNNNVIPGSISDLKVANEFTWETTSTVEVEITPVNRGFIIIQDEEANVLYKGIVNPQPNTLNITVPSALAKAVIYFNGAREEFTVTGIKKFSSKLK